MMTTIKSPAAVTQMSQDDLQTYYRAIATELAVERARIHRLEVHCAYVQRRLNDRTRTDPKLAFQHKVLEAIALGYVTSSDITTYLDASKSHVRQTLLCLYQEGKVTRTPVGGRKRFYYQKVYGAAKPT